MIPPIFPTISSFPPISFIGSERAATNTVSVPSHQTGDFIIGLAWRNSTTAPSLPTGQNWTNYFDGPEGSYSWRCFYKIARNSSESFGTATNSSSSFCVVYRGANGLGNYNANYGTFSSTHTYEGFTLDVADGSSWVAGFAITNGSPGAPSGLTSRINGSGYRQVDTNGGVSTFSNVSASHSLGFFFTLTLEILQG